MDGKTRHLEAYDGHQLTLLGSLTCDDEWNGSKLTQTQLAVVQPDKEFGLLGRDLLPKHGVNNITAEHLPAVKSYKAPCEGDTRNTANVLQSQKNISTSSDLPEKYICQKNISEKLKQMVRQGILEPVQPGAVTNAFPVVWQRRKCGELRHCVDLKVHIKGKVMDEDYPVPYMETIFHNLYGASYFGKIDLSDAYYQNELEDEAKYICKINTSQGLFKMCRLPQGLKNSSELHRINTQRNQRCCDLSRRCNDVWNYQGAVRQEKAYSQESTT